MTFTDWLMVALIASAVVTLFSVINVVLFHAIRSLTEVLTKRHTLREMNDKLRAQLAAFQLDVERYRHLRDAHPADYGPCIVLVNPQGKVVSLRHETADTVIDAARSKA